MTVQKGKKQDGDNKIQNRPRAGGQMLQRKLQASGYLGAQTVHNLLQSRKEKQILSNISGSLSSGKVCALMGPSGAGPAPKPAIQGSPRVFGVRLLAPNLAVFVSVTATPENTIWQDLARLCTDERCASVWYVILLR